MNVKINISKECRDAFLVGYPVCEQYFQENYIPGNDLVVELANGYEVVSVEEVE